VLEAYSAAELFLHTARQARPDLALDAGDAAAVGEICRLAQGLPLALVLLATWVRVLPCRELLQELRNSIDLVRSTHPAADDKETSLRSVFEQSWQRLRAGERTVLAALSVFSGSFDRPSAAAVAGADLDILSRLVDHSLLHAAGDGRYSWHELVRRYCAEQLADAGGFEDAARRHFAHYLAQAEANAAQLADFNNLAAFLWFGRERANLQAASAWAAGAQADVTPADRRRLADAVARAGHRWGVHMGSV
jgi:predicted ATPase